jgi:hypothetical protein
MTCSRLAYREVTDRAGTSRSPENYGSIAKNASIKAALSNAPAREYRPLRGVSLIVCHGLAEHKKKTGLGVYSKAR